MIKKILSTALSLTIVLSTANSYAQNINIKIGVIDAAKIMQEAKISIQAQQKINTEGKRHQQEIEVIANKGRTELAKLEKEEKNLPAPEITKRREMLDEIDKSFTQAQNQASQDIEKLKNTEFSNVLNTINNVIKTVANQEKYDLIIQDAVYSGPNVDITNKIIEILNK